MARAVQWLTHNSAAGGQYFSHESYIGLVANLSEDLDLGNSSLTSEISLERVMDGKEESKRQEDFGSSSEPSVPTTQHEWQKYFKRFQLTVLLIFLATLFLLMLFDTFLPNTDPQGEEYLDQLLPVLLPIFSFLLGMSVKSRDD